MQLQCEFQIMSSNLAGCSGTDVPHCIVHSKKKNVLTSDVEVKGMLGYHVVAA